MPQAVSSNDSQRDLVEQLRVVIRDLPDLRAELVRLVWQIPPGRVASFGQLAAALGDKAAARWVGHAVRHEIRDDSLPLHRIVQADGSPGGHLHAAKEQTLKVLAAEGACVANGRVDLDTVAADLSATQPLARLRKLQESFKPVIPTERREPPQSIAGVDVSYRGDEAVACYARLDSTEQFEPSFTCLHHGSVEFPYISGYLTYRELPLLTALIEEVRQQGQLAEVILVDGSGILHPRRAGSAAMFGAVAEVPTIGVTKKLLVGQTKAKPTAPGEVQPVTVDGEIAGHVLLPHSGPARPLYVSPGHQISVADAFEVVRGCLGRRRLPTPIYWADRLSRQAARV